MNIYTLVLILFFIITPTCLVARVRVRSNVDLRWSITGDTIIGIIGGVFASRCITLLDVFVEVILYTTYIFGHLRVFLCLTIFIRNIFTPQVYQYVDTYTVQRSFLGTSF